MRNTSKIPSHLRELNQIKIKSRSNHNLFLNVLKKLSKRGKMCFGDYLPKDCQISGKRLFPLNTHFLIERVFNPLIIILGGDAHGIYCFSNCSFSGSHRLLEQRKKITAQLPKVAVIF